MDPYTKSESNNSPFDFRLFFELDNIWWWGDVDIPPVYTINPLALELDIYGLAHHLCKMWISYEPRRVT